MGKMKVKKIAALMAAGILCTASLVGCGSGSDFAGKWEVKKLSMGDQTIEGDINGTPVAVAFQIELKDNGEGEILVAESDSEKINWEADGDTVTVKSQSGSTQDIKLTKDGDELKAEQDGTNMVLVKVDEFTERPAE